MISNALSAIIPKPDRRRFLKAAGVTLALPLLESLAPRLRAGEKSQTPRRMLCICTPLGLQPEYFFPEQPGTNYELSPYLDVVKEFRSDFTVISGLAHPDVGASHDSIFSFLTGAPHPELRAGFRNTISVDQVAAEQIGEQTRFASLSLSAEGFGLSWTQSGALVPPDIFPSTVFARLFLEGRPDEVETQKRRLRDGQSILDSVGDGAKRLKPAIGVRDREKLDEYFTSVRELERRMVTAEEWSKKPKPKVDAKPPQNNMNPADLIGKNRLLFDLVHLAIQTDSTRLITMLLLGTSLVPPIPGVSLGHHDLTHHGQEPEKMAQLKVLELAKMETVREFLEKMKQTKEGDETLLNRTMVFLSSNLGNASMHSTKNLPILFAGGGFRHCGHLAFDKTNPPPLCNLYVSMLQRLGIETDRFGSSTGTLTGFEAVG